LFAALVSPSPPLPSNRQSLNARYRKQAKKNQAPVRDVLENSKSVEILTKPYWPKEPSETPPKSARNQADPSTTDPARSLLQDGSMKTESLNGDLRNGADLGRLGRRWE
jgi:hypothetical protein